MQLERGEVLGIAGLIGAGRTEFLRAMFGLDAVKSGRIRVAAVSGGELVTTGPRRGGMWNAGVGMLSEDRKTEGLAQSMTIADNITLSELERVGGLGFIFPGMQREAAEMWGRACSSSAADVCAAGVGSFRRQSAEGRAGAAASS